MNTKHLLIGFLVIFGVAACDGDFAKHDAHDASGDAVSSDSMQADAPCVCPPAPAADASAPRPDVQTVAVAPLCGGKCSGYDAKASCQCDKDCKANSDCCSDYVACPAPVAKCPDKDEDGYCDKMTPLDCDDGNAKVHPGAVEDCGNTIDDNCDGQVNEGCVAATNSGNSLTVTYPNAFSRTLNVQVTSNKADLGKYWDSGSVTSTGTTLIKDLGSIISAPCLYVRWNVIDSNPATPYGSACIGNGSTANMDINAVPMLKLLGQNFSKADLATWSAPGGTNAGCSGEFVKGAGCTP